MFTLGLIWKIVLFSFYSVASSLKDYVSFRDSMFHGANTNFFFKPWLFLGPFWKPLRSPTLNQNYQQIVKVLLRNFLCILFQFLTSWLMILVHLERQVFFHFCSQWMRGISFFVLFCICVCFSVLIFFLFFFFLVDDLELLKEEFWHQQMKINEFEMMVQEVGIVAGKFKSRKIITMTTA